MPGSEGEEARDLASSVEEFPHEAFQPAGDSSNLEGLEQQEEEEAAVTFAIDS